jgi:hypothetical protein
MGRNSSLSMMHTTSLLPHLMLLKEVTDQGRLQYDHPLGLCLVAAGRGDTIPLKETFDLPDPTWLQFRRRFDKLAPFCREAFHTSEEVRDILSTLEQEYQQLFPQLNPAINGPVRSTLGSPIQSSTRPAQAASRWTT